MNQENKNRAQHAIDYSLKLGADQSDIILNTGRSLSIASSDKKIDKYQISSSQIIGIRVIKDQKIGISYTESFDEKSISVMVENALENSKYSSSAPLEKIEVPKGYLESNLTKTFKEDDATIDEKIERAKMLEVKVIEGHENAKAPYTGISESIVESYYLNHLGRETYDKRSYATAGTSALLTDGKKQSMHSRYAIGRAFHDIDPLICIEDSLTMSKDLLYGMPIKSGAYDVIFTTSMLGNLISSFSSVLFSGKAAMDGKNIFKDKIGDVVAHKGLTISDDPQYCDALEYSEFDSEGVNQSKLSIIENGILKNLYHNTMTAAYFKTVTNGRGSRGAKTSLSVSGTNLVIGAGKNTKTEVFEGKVLEIVSLAGLHSGTNPITGDFSLGASGFLYEDGKRIQAVREITVSGNFFKLLKNIAKIGNEIKSDDYKGFFAPDIKFSSLSIAGL